MATFNSYTVDEIREIVDPDHPETLLEQAKGWAEMADLLSEYGVLLEQRLELVEDSWTGDAARLYFDEVKRMQEYIEESAERATTNAGLWFLIGTLAGIAKHDVSYIHKLWKDLDNVTDAVGLGFILEAIGVDKAVEDFKRMPYDVASRQIMEATATAAEESYSQMRDFEEFKPPPDVDGSGPSLQSVSAVAPPGGAVSLPSTTVASTAAMPPLGPVAMRPVVPGVIGSRPGMTPMPRPMMGPGHTVRPVIGQRTGESQQTKTPGRLIGRYGVVSATPDVDMRDPKASRIHYGGDDVNRGVIKNNDPQRAAEEARFKLEEEVLRLRERAFAHRADDLTPAHTQHVLPGIVGDDSGWDRKTHDPGPVAFEMRRRPDRDDDAWTVI